MLNVVEVEQGTSLNDYAGNAQLAPAVHDLRAEASALLPRLGGRKVWMVNSTAAGGGVAEMLPKLVGLMREVGVPTDWLVFGTDREDFFPLTKRLHNLIHGTGDSKLTASDRELYAAVSRDLAAELKARISPADVLVVHDPQPAGMGALVAKELGVHSIWRCHIGLDRQTPETKAAWEFLHPYVTEYDHAVFSAPEYIPDFLSGSVSIIHPALDPLSYKNRELNPHVLAVVLCNAGLMSKPHPVLLPDYETKAQRLQPDGEFGAATRPEEIGLLFRTVVTQVSRWDRLKGWEPLLDAFVGLKRLAEDPSSRLTDHDRRRIEISRLVLAGPEPAAVADDPEARGVLDELCSKYRSLPEGLQRDVVLLSLPMQSRKVNALMVNALQRCSSVVVQNSIQEGFGLTVTEAMWKRIAVLGSAACGIRQQIRDRVDGRLNPEPWSSEVLGSVLLEMLNDNEARMEYGRSAQRRANDEFLVFTQVRRWLEVLAHTVDQPPPSIY